MPFNDGRRPGAGSGDNCADGNGACRGWCHPRSGRGPRRVRIITLSFEQDGLLSLYCSNPGLDDADRATADGRLPAVVPRKPCFDGGPGVRPRQARCRPLAGRGHIPFWVGGTTSELSDDGVECGRLRDVDDRGVSGRPPQARAYRAWARLAEAWDQASRRSAPAARLRRRPLREDNVGRGRPRGDVRGRVVVIVVTRRRDAPPPSCGQLSRRRWGRAGTAWCGDVGTAFRAGHGEREVAGPPLEELLVDQGWSVLAVGHCRQPSAGRMSRPACHSRARGTRSPCPQLGRFLEPVVDVMTSGARRVCMGTGWDARQRRLRHACSGRQVPRYVGHEPSGEPLHMISGSAI